MEILIAVTAKIVEYTMKPIGRQLGYLYYYNSNVKNLANQVEELKESRESVKHKVYEARRNAEDIKVDVQKWLSNVDVIIEESVMILVNEGQTNKKCSSGLCLNLVQRHKLSRKAKKMAGELSEIKKEGNFERVSYDVALSRVGSSTKVSDFLSFESRKSTMEEIMDALLDNNINRIGVYGMGGVGKTMLVKEISRRVMEKNVFDEVVVSTISQTPNLKGIQGQLGDILGLKFEQETVEGRAIKLYKRLKMEKRILIVLDDIWKYIDLETIGIPSVADHKGCKILFTSRDKHILSNDMSTNQNFEIKVLQQDEPWNLFKQIAGEIVEAPNLRSMAIQIVKECAQLPIAITIVAKALRNKPFSIWRDALNQLGNLVVVNIKGMDEKVFSSLKLSYEQLESEEAKLLFLLCSMFPEDFPIYMDDLHTYTMGMGLLHGVDTLAQGRHRIIKLVDDLISSSLLLGYESRDNFVKMHDIIRDVAILIASNDDRIRTLSHVQGLNEWQEEKMSGNYTAVYLRFGGLHDPPQKLMLPKVQLLTLEENNMFPTYELSRTFFEDMKELKVLKVKEIKISLLPPSLSFANLRSLHMLNCELGNIDMIGELKKLEILKFRGSNIVEVPMAISQLTQLKVLELSFCRRLKVIPPNILSKLTKLEELDLEYSFVGWEGEELHRQRKNISLSELKYLSCLSTLNLCIQDEKVMPKQLFSRELNLERFKIIIGRERYVRKSGNSKILYLKMESGCYLDDWIKTLLKSSEELNIRGSISTRDLLFEIDDNGSSHLKHLDLQDNSKIQYFIHEKKKNFWKAFSHLETLSLSKLENLENIIHGHVRESPFSKLRVIRVKNCNKLRNLFFSSIVNGLMDLKKINISLCEMLEVIVIMESEEAISKIEFTHLYSLKLDGVPRLTSFCSNNEELAQLSLDNLQKVGKGKFSSDRPFFNKQVSLLNLETLIIREAHRLKTIYHNELIPHSFANLKRVDISYCDNLEKVFPSNMMSTLRCLKSLEIVGCNILEGIFEVQEPNATEKYGGPLPQLSSLKLIDLPNLKHVWRKDPHELEKFENIHHLSVIQCPKLKRVYPLSVLHLLELLEIEYSELMEILGKEKPVKPVEMDPFKSSKAEIIELWDDSELFPKLKTLKLLGSLDDKCTHFPMEIAQILHNLEELEVKEAFFEEIFPNEIFINARSESLRSLYLSKLPKLRHLWKESSQKNTLLLQNLQFLYVWECGRLNFLVPSSVSSFRNLRSLSIYKCDGLTHLLNPRVAKTLVQLRYMVLGGCKRLATVVEQGSGAEEENYEIVFNQLQHLALSDFPTLTSFHSGKCTIGFPRLDSVDVKNCPEMKIFSLGIVSTPCLETKKIQLYSEDGYLLTRDSEEIIVKDINVIVWQAWENDYDSSIQHLFIERSLEEKQSDDPSSSDVDELESDGSFIIL